MDEKVKSLAAYLANKPPCDSPPDDGRIGKPVDWSLVIPSITRPISEAPALEVLDFFEILMEDGYFSFNMSSESMKAAFPDPDIRLRFVDLMCECNSLQRYQNWAWSTIKEAERRGDERRVRFYTSLEKEIKWDWEAVWKEAVPVYNAILPGSPFEEWKSDVDFEEKREESEVGDERSESSCSFVTARNGDGDSQGPVDLNDL